MGGELKILECGLIWGGDKKCLSRDGWKRCCVVVGGGRAQGSRGCQRPQG